MLSLNALVCEDKVSLLFSNNTKIRRSSSVLAEFRVSLHG